MNRVFVFEPTQLDISDLKRYGEVTYLFSEQEGRRPLRDEGLEDQILSKLTFFGYDPSKDYIALVGSQVGLVILATAATSLWGPLSFLVFDTISRRYYERRLGTVREYIEA